MKKILTLLLAAASLTACDIDRLPYNSMAAEQITNDPSASLESLMNGMYAQLKTWSDPMHRCGEYAGDNMMIRGSSTDAFYEFISFSRTPVNYRLQNFWDYGYKAEEMMTINKGAAYASKEAAQAMLSRVYLYMSGTYENPNREYAQLAVDYADKVINSGNYSLLPREEFMKYNTLTPENNDESIFVVKRVASEFSGYDHYYGIGGMYANIGGMGWGEMYASAKYIDLLNETGRNDWRPDHYKIVDARAAFIEPTYTDDHKEVFRFIKQDSETVLNYEQLTVIKKGATVICQKTKEVDGKDVPDGPEYTLTPVDAEQEIYSITYQDGKTYTGVLDYYISLNRVYPQFYITKCSREGEDSHLHSPIISRLSEIYLNRAEAYAKLGNYSAALADLNTIRERSIIGGGYASLDATNASERIDKERQLELAYQAERSYDVFRNGKPLTRRYPGPHQQFEDIPASDYRVIYYIPQNAINAYPGTLTQNPTDNSGVILN